MLSVCLPHAYVGCTGRNYGRAFLLIAAILGLGTIMENFWPE